MSKDNKEKDALNITEEENVQEQFEFGLNEDKREEIEKDGQKLPEDQAVEVSHDAEIVDDEKK